MTQSFTPQRALVLGGTSDIGLAVVDRLVADGLNDLLLTVRDRESDSARALLNRWSNVSITLLEWDATAVDGHHEFAVSVCRDHGPIDLVICTVGALGHHAGLAMDAESIHSMFMSNTVGPVGVLNELAHTLDPHVAARIVVFSSVAAVRPRKSNYIYGSSKSALDSAARGLRDALAHTSIDVVIVRAGFVHSSMTVGLEPAPFASQPEIVGKAVAERIRSGKGGVMWTPKILGPLFAVLSVLPIPIWRRVAGDR